jgi:2-oxoglutarate dehydrogenase E2 component (dihydrolipoamide succinyltransferase)
VLRACCRRRRKVEKVAPAPAAEGKPAAAAVHPCRLHRSAAKLLAENNISADQVDGSGKRGQVLKGDVHRSRRQGHYGVYRLRLLPPTPVKRPRAPSSEAMRRAKSA